MAWNHPKEVVAQPPPKKHLPRFVLGALCLVLCVVVGMAWLFWPEGERGEAAASTKRETIREVKNVTRRTTHEARSTKLSHPDGAPTNKVELTKNVTPPKALNSCYYECVSGGRPHFKRPIFKHTSENIIAGILASRPGTRFLPVDMDEEFDEDFKKSLDEEIEISPDDDPDDALVKEAMIKARDEFRKLMSKGQKPSEIVNDMHNEMNKIADYRDLMQEDFDKIKETGSAKDVEAYLKEANELLKEFDAEPLDLPEDEIEEINERLSKEQPAGEPPKGEDK